MTRHLFITDWGPVALDENWLDRRWGAKWRKEFAAAAPTQDENGDWNYRAMGPIERALDAAITPWAKALWEAGEDLDGRVYAPEADT